MAKEGKQQYINSSWVVFVPDAKYDIKNLFVLKSLIFLEIFDFIHKNKRNLFFRL
jgi:hypothetical protein